MGPRARSAAPVIEVPDGVMVATKKWALQGGNPSRKNWYQAFAACRRNGAHPALILDRGSSVFWGYRPDKANFVPYSPAHGIVDTRFPQFRLGNLQAAPVVLC